jgi:hypothetical protein
MVSFLEFKFEFWREKKITTENNTRDKNEVVLAFGSNFDGRDQSDEP